VSLIRAVFAGRVDPRLSTLNVENCNLHNAIRLLIHVWHFVPAVASGGDLVSDERFLLYGGNPTAGVLDGFLSIPSGTAKKP
jgi:hypothetical protein